ncbi:MAG: sialate O-acetylesterase [Eubacteriales bacterium]
MKKTALICLSVLMVLSLFTGCGPDPSVTDLSDAVTDTASESGSVPESEDDGTLILSYDDRYIFDKEIERIENVSVTSRKAGGDTSDESVISLAEDGENKKVIASGTGDAVITFCDGETLEVRVKPAVINLFLVAGQSNAEGYTTTETASFEASRSQCVMCEEGQVYSTYAPGHSADWGTRTSGVLFTRELSVDNADTFVAQSLTSDKNLKGDTLAYPLNHLTTAGAGKTGIDAAVAYQWHELTGEKVWMVNAGNGSSSISTWYPRATKTDNDFHQAVGLFRNCQDVLDREIEAGHYSLNKMGYFWLQGCADLTMTSEQYMYYYEKFHKGLEEELKYNFDGTEKELDFGGIIMVRAASSEPTGNADIALNGPRLAQYYMAESDDSRFDNIYLATNIGDLLVDTDEVREYFSAKYPNGITYPIKVMQDIPDSIAQVHPDVHYRQFGYNELGFDAANNIYSSIYGVNADSVEIKLTEKDGFTALGAGGTITLSPGSTRILVPIVYPNFASSDGVRMTADCAGVSTSGFVLSAAGNAVSGTTGTLKIYIGDVLYLTYTIRII